MASSSSPAPKLIVPDENSANNKGGSNHSPVRVPTIVPPNDETSTKKLTKMLSTQSSFDRHHAPHPVGKRFSIDADPSSIILNTPVTDLSNDPSQQPSPTDGDENSSNFISTNLTSKSPSPGRGSSLKKSDSFLEIPYEKGEIVDLIKLADDPNSAAHMTHDGHEVLLEHGTAPQ